ncbi:MAG: hypothetical protein ABI321_06780 [Polyangia bacterium]
MRIAAALVLAFAFAGCREGAGSHCTKTSDCRAGLACILPVGGTPQTGGVCSTLDASVELDFAMPDDDGGTDGSTDASATDASKLFDAGEDFSEVD